MVIVVVVMEVVMVMVMEVGEAWRWLGEDGTLSPHLWDSRTSHHSVSHKRLRFSFFPLFMFGYG